MSSNKADNGDKIRSKTQQFKEYLTTHLSPHALYDIDNHTQNEFNTNPNIAHLQQKYQFEQLQQKLIQMKQQNKQLLIENNKLKTVVRALTQFVKTGPKPAYDSVQMMKKQNQEWSKRINKLKQQIYLKQLRNKTNKTKNKSNSMCIQITQTDEQKIDNEFISDNILQENITEFMETNSLNNNNPVIIIKDTKNDICITNEVNASDLLQSFVIQKPHRIPALVGEIGVRTKKFISKGTVLGQFTGTEYLSDEYKEIYGESNEYNTRNMYAYETNVCIGNDKSNLKTVNVIIDGWDNRNSNQLIYINDCRKGMNVNVPTKDDYKYWNCCFKNVLIDEWPCVVVIARRDIKIGEELNLFYGNNYGKWSKSNDMCQVFKARVRGLIDDSVLKLIGMENDISDIYRFDNSL